MLKLLMPNGLSHDYRTVRRFFKIVELMGRYGFCDLAENIYPNHRFHWMKKSGGSGSVRYSRPEKLRMLFEELGPTFVKLGQILSTRTDLISKAYTDELAKLTEHVPPFPFSEVESIIRQEFGRSVGELFLEFSREPIAAASIGQVHGARLPDGMEVVVKVRRPGIVETINTDLEIMRFIAVKMEEYSEGFARMEPSRIVSEFAYSLKRELNYRAEAANLLLFRKNMAGTPHMKVPALIDELSSERVLTMERIHGDSVASILADPAKREKYDLKFLAETGVNSLLSQIFEYGFFHADPHPGNIFIEPGNILVFIDFGMMSRVSMKERNDFVKVMDYLLRDEISLMIDCALHMTITGKYAGSRDELERDAADLICENINLPLEKISVARILERLLELFEKYHMALKPNLYMMFKALITIEQIGRSFDPKLKIVEMVEPFIRKMKLRGFDPRNHLRRFLDNFGENLTALERLPVSLRDVMSKFEEGRLTLRVEHHRLNDIEETLYVTGERLSRSMLVSALLVGSALLVVAKIPPYWGENTSVIGMFGFLISGGLSLVILIADHRQRRNFLKERVRRRREDAQKLHK
ncbi:AarF/ABC1/UbiB kinase family protein [uncultured Victivallis sp.]|uniref:ABC1 kinase family protein n=1 Tax=uncultured Victivallis sp. TaxID=354118 RepID=UPI0025E8D97C|nr:AarF/ABC1/UbiB kinase family protein [uncultured Victivallis sp.]